MVVDLVHNRDLRDKYPIIEQIENKHRKLQSDEINEPVYKNDFIVIGSFDGERIESMFTYSSIDDVNYEKLYGERRIRCCLLYSH